MPGTRAHHRVATAAAKANNIQVVCSGVQVQSMPRDKETAASVTAQP